MVLAIFATWCHGESHDSYDGYSPAFPDVEVEAAADDGGDLLGAVAMVNRESGFECPSPNVITTRYRCKVRGDHWTDCLRSNCCPGYTHVAGRCISDSESPCRYTFVTSVHRVCNCRFFHSFLVI